MSTLATLFAAFATAAAVWVTWWLGVWGLLRTLVARVQTLEADVDFLRTSARREIGRASREVQVVKQSAEDRELAKLEAAVAARSRGKGPPPVRSAPRLPDNVDVAPGADRVFAGKGDPATVRDAPGSEHVA